MTTDRFSDLGVIAEECFRTAISKGWWDFYIGPDGAKKEMTPDEIASRLCLIHSEVSEGLEEVRNGKPHWYLHNGKPEGLAAELADVIIRIFDLTGYLGIDIAEAVKLKMAYNKTRSHRHGGKAL